ncbi:helix-turn-helix domain-containing protein [Streptomyces sp. NPDC006385]|uniref:PucR family transcriptional regulator n=1 Tax=Streptomyces sp. NPDC006385 TaxID=3156761 RepID=UPI0033AF1350
MRRRLPALTSDVLTRLRAHHPDSAFDGACVHDSLSAWLAALADEAADEEISARFHGLATAGAGRGIAPDVIAAIQQAAAEALLRGFITCLTRSQSDVMDVNVMVSRRIIEVIQTATAAIVGTHRTPGTERVPRPRDADAHHRDQAVVEALLDPRTSTCPPPLPSHVKGPLRWCAASLPLGDRLLQALRRARAANPAALVGRCADRVVLLTGDRPLLPEDLRPHGLAPVTYEGVAQAAQQALRAAEVAGRFAVDHVEAPTALPLITVMAQDQEERDAFVASCLGPLCTDTRHAHLEETLRAYLEHGLCAAAAARSLFVHRRTFEYRLQQIKQLTGLDLTHPLHRLRAEIALYLCTPHVTSRSG